MDANMTYEEYVKKVKLGIVTEEGNCPVTPLLIMLSGKWKSQIDLRNVHKGAYTLRRA